MSETSSGAGRYVYRLWKLCLLREWLETVKFILIEHCSIPKGKISGLLHVPEVAFNTSKKAGIHA